MHQKRRKKQKRMPAVSTARAGLRRLEGRGQFGSGYD